MSLSSNVSDLATRIATEVKALRTLINGNVGSLSSLTTTAKSNLVAAINEVAASVSGSSGIADGTTATTSTWSSSKIASSISSAVSNVVNSAPAALDTLNELATALGNDANFATTTATALGNRVRVDAAQSLTGTQKTQARSNIDAAYTTDVGDTTTNFVTTFESGLV